MMKKATTNWVLGLSTAAAVTAMLAGCDPVPRRTLDLEDKEDDLRWIYGKFKENYAPLDYKQSRLKFDFADLKKKYLAEAAKTTTNDEFYELMMQFVSEFQDAHTSAALTNSSLPDRAKVAFLGFSGIRNGDSLFVKSILPTIEANSKYPIKVGDEIIEINGKSLKAAVDAEMIKYRNMGFDETNYTYHFNKLFSRVSTANGLPKEREVTLKIKRSNKERTVTLPWVTMDIVKFQEEQEAAKKKAAAPGSTEQEKVRTGNILMLADQGTSPVLKFNFLGFDGRMEMPFDNIQKITLGLKRKITDSFRFIDAFAQWELADGTKTAEKAPLDRLAENRKVLDDAIYIAGSKTYPSYVSPQSILDKDGKDTGEKKLVGYVYLDTFSPNEGTEEVLKEFKATLASFKNLGVRDIIIDTINNGGGSLELGMQMAQALSPATIEQPKIQFRLSDTWLDQYHDMALNGSDVATKEYANRLLVELTSERQAGRRLSQPYSAAEALYRYTIEANADLTQAFRVKLLINEMCASMCDIFAAMVQDNGLGQVIGTRSMGAGGNVVNHNQAPNSHLDLRQTESLFLRKDGSYVENNGVTPDVAIAVVNSAKDKYDDVIDKAVELIVKKTE